MTQDILIMTYFADFHLIMDYGIIFRGNSKYGNTIFILQKRGFKNNYRLGNRDSCYEVFKDLNIITLTPQYIYPVLCIISNQDEFASVSEMKRIFTRQVTNFYQRTSKSTLYQRGITNMGITIYNKLLPSLKNASDNSKTFKTLLKMLLYSNSFYTLMSILIIL
jgi:hypothetical protein